jgi:hypothetical protein
VSSKNAKHKYPNWTKGFPKFEDLESPMPKAMEIPMPTTIPPKPIPPKITIIKE